MSSKSVTSICCDTCGDFVSSCNGVAVQSTYDGCKRVSETYWYDEDTKHVCLDCLAALAAIYADQVSSNT